jgi:hypothetical protein
MVPSIDLFDDAIGISGPDEGLEFAVVPAEVAATGDEAKKVSTEFAWERQVGVK